MLRPPSGRIEWEPPPPKPTVLRRSAGPHGGRFLFLPQAWSAKLHTSRVTSGSTVEDARELWQRV